MPLPQFPMFLLWDGDEDRLEPFTGQRFQAERLALRRASSLPRGDPGAARLDQGPRQAAGHSLPQQPAPRHRPYYARQTDAEVGGGGRHPEEALPFPYSEAFLRHALTGEGLRDRTSPGLDGTRQYSIQIGVRQNYEPKKAANGRRAEGHLALKRSSAIPDRKSTRLNSSHLGISYAVFCLKKKEKIIQSLRRLHRCSAPAITSIHAHQC